MTVALWIIAICEIIRIIQNALQLWALHAEKNMRQGAYAEFVRSLRGTDKEFVKSLLKEFEAQEDNK